MASIGCICCLNQGLINEYEVFGQTYVSIHHVRGRTVIHCHYYCLPLCQCHHDTPLPKDIQSKYPSIFPVHAKGSVGGKTAWELTNGTQEALIKQVWEILGFSLPEVA